MVLRRLRGLPAPLQVSALQALQVSALQALQVSALQALQVSALGGGVRMDLSEVGGWTFWKWPLAAVFHQPQA